MSDYCDHLEKVYNGKYVAVYLSPSGGDPDICSLSTERRENLKPSGRYVPMSYATGLREWLKECISACRSERVTWFLRELDGYFAHNASLAAGDSMTSEKKLILEYATRSTSRLETALRIGECYEELQSGIINAFTKRVVDKIAATLPSSDWTLLRRDFAEKRGRGLISIFRSSWAGQCEVKLDTYGKDLFIGIFDHLPLDPQKCEQIFSQLNKFRPGLKELPKWPWWQYLNPDYKNWSRSEFLLSLHREDKQPLDYVVGQLCNVALIAAPIIDGQISESLIHKLPPQPQPKPEP